MKTQVEFNLNQSDNSWVESMLKRITGKSGRGWALEFQNRRINAISKGNLNAHDEFTLAERNYLMDKFDLEAEDFQLLNNAFNKVEPRYQLLNSAISRYLRAEGKFLV